MLEQIVRITVNFTVNDGQLDAFNAIAQAMTEVADAEPGTLGYEWFESADHQKFSLLEIYTGASAVEAHFKGACVQHWVPKLAGIWNVQSLEFFGDPGPVVHEMAGVMHPVYFDYRYGISR